MQFQYNVSSVEHDECVGCGACVANCPKSCISMIRNGLFAYPKVNSIDCIQCGKCLKICPAINISIPNTHENPIGSYYYAWNTDRVQRATSTSGGVGSALAKHAIDNQYAVCGAELSPNMEVKHIISTKSDIIDKIKGSKYVESSIKPEIYHAIQNLMKDGKRVLFFGTPCQVSAIQNITPTRLKHLLLTCEIICHGVNSSLVWQDYIEDLQRKNHSIIKNYNFRSKSKGWGKLRVSIEFENGKKIDVPAWKNLFHIWFGRHYILRRSCQLCKYRKINRQADLCIGDFWGFEKIDPSIDQTEGISILVARTSKGNSFIKNIPNLYLHEVTPQKAIMVLKGYTEHRRYDVIKKELDASKEFECKYIQLDFSKIASLYPCPSFYDLAKRPIMVRIKRIFHK